MFWIEGKSMGGRGQEGRGGSGALASNENENNENMRHFGNFVFSKKWPPPPPLHMNDIYAYARMGWDMRGSCV